MITVRELMRLTGDAGLDADSVVGIAFSNDPPDGLRATLVGFRVVGGRLIAQVAVYDEEEEDEEEDDDE